MGLPLFKEYARFYDKIYVRRDYKAEAKFVYEWACKPKVIADLGCGTGRHHKYWKCFIIGIDQSKEMLKYCKTTKERIYWRENIEDFYSLYAPCFTALFNVIGYCNLDKVMSCMKQTKDEVFIFDVWDKEKVEKENYKFKVKKFKWGYVHIIPLSNSLQIIIYPKKDGILEGEIVSETHMVKPYSEKEIKYLCKKYGYSMERKDTKTWTTYYKLTKV